MISTANSRFAQRRHLETLDRGALEQLQLEKLNRLLDEVYASNELYQHKLAGARAR